MFEFDEKQLRKLDQMREDGVDPYPAGEKGVLPLSVMDGMREMPLSVLEEVVPVRVFGRLRFKNEMGKLGFGRIEDDGGRVQICVRKNEVSEESFKAWKRLDLGDIVYVSGTYGRTRSGELTLFASELSLASKCVLPMPDKLAGVSDRETEYRQRYLALAVSSDMRDLFKLRSGTVSVIRRMLESRGFMEVETPMLHSIPGGALAKPFITHHNALDQEMYLRIAPELHLKRLLVGGFPRVFEINRCFRNEGIGTKYNPEFTTVELYEAHATYNDLIELISNLITEIARFVPAGNPVDFTDITRIRFDDAIRNLGIENPWDTEQLRAFWVSRRDVSDELPETVSDWFELIFDEFIQDTLINPTFITNHPAENSPLARKTDGDPRTVDRFELYIRGMEVSDGWTELNNPIEQAENFVSQVEKREGGDEEAMLFDEDFVRALSYGMPPAAGVGLGIDRLMMVICNKKSIRDVILFPTLRRE